MNRALFVLAAVVIGTFLFVVTAFEQSIDVIYPKCSLKPFVYDPQRRAGHRWHFQEEYRIP